MSDTYASLGCPMPSQCMEECPLGKLDGSDERFMARRLIRQVAVWHGNVMHSLLTEADIEKIVLDEVSIEATEKYPPEVQREVVNILANKLASPCIESALDNKLL